MKILALALLVILVSSHRPVSTIITGLFDIGRGNLPTYKRTHSTYLGFFRSLLLSSSNMIIFGQKPLAEQVWKIRKPENTIFIQYQIQQFRTTWFHPMIIAAINGLKKNVTFWQLWAQKPHYALELYMDVMVSKVLFMEKALEYDKWNSDNFFWVDAGLAKHIPKQLFTQGGWDIYFQRTNHPWITKGGDKNDLFVGYAQTEVRYVGKQIPQHNEAGMGGFFGGYIELVKDFKNCYQNILRIVLENGDTNSDQAILTLMVAKYPYLMFMLDRIDPNLFKNTVFKSHRTVKQRIVRESYARFENKKLQIYDQVLESQISDQKLSEKSDKNKQFFFKLSAIFIVSVGIYAYIRIKKVKTISM